MSRPCFVAFEGIDGSGKTVQVDMLESLITGDGRSVMKLSFPRYDGGFFGVEIGRMLADKRHPNAMELNPRDMSLWYALDRFDQMRGWREWDIDFVLLNRFSLSNMAFQGSRLQSGEDVGEFARWLDELEHVILDLPRPDAYIIFDVSPHQSRINVAGKGIREYAGDDADLHERNEDFQARVRSRYRELASEMGNVEIVDCLTVDGAMRTEDDIHIEALGMLRLRGLV